MSQSGRPSLSIYDYPEHLNPFNEEIPGGHGEVKAKDSKHKFWTFGRSKKKRSNSFSIKSTWSGLFGKRKEPQDVPEKRSTITTVSSTYKKEPCYKPPAPPRISRDQQEFDEALGTLARRRKYTLDNSSRYSSSLTVNGDPARIYDGSPQDTTTSILGSLTPKAPARRFGQVSPKPRDKIPPLDFESKEPKENGTVTLRENTQDGNPVPPMRRFGARSSQRLNTSNLDPEDDPNRSGDVTLRDENENVPDDYVFKRISHDAVRKSNLSINSCTSIGSTVSAYGRKKRRAPQPPRRSEQLSKPEESSEKSEGTPNIELQIVEPSDIAKVAETIDEMTKKSKELGDLPVGDEIKPAECEKVEPGDALENESASENVEKPLENEKLVVEDTLEKAETSSVEKPEQIEPEASTESDSKDEIRVKNNSEHQKSMEKDTDSTEVKSKETEAKDGEEENIKIEYRRTSQENLEIIKDVNEINSTDELEEVCLRRKSSSGTLSRSDSFSVKEEIEKIERQIKALETRSSSKDSSSEGNTDELNTSSRQSIQANRRHFFQNMVDDENGKASVKIEFKELPREQKDIHVIRLTDPPVPVAAPRDPVKVIELHISEPIKQKPEILDDVNPLPKPRRHSALNLNGSQTSMVSREERQNFESSDKRGKSF